VDFVKLKEVVSYRGNFFVIDDDISYKRCRVQLHRRGVVLRDVILGGEIKTKKQRLCKTNDFIVAEMDAKFGGYGVIPEELDGAIVSSHYYLYEVDTTQLDLAFLETIIDAGIIQDQIKAVGSTNYSRVSAKEVLEYEIPCPALARQQEISQLYAKYKTTVQVLSTELDHQTDLLQKLRQRLLQEAIEGKLTAGWRAAHPDVEPASELLERIQAEKERLIAERKIRKQKALPPINADEIPFDLPQGWEWAKMGDLGIVTRGKGPKYDETGKSLILNQKCVRWFHVDIQHAKKVSDSWFNSISKNFQTVKDDVLVNSTGEGTIGRAAIVDTNSQGFLFDSHLLRFQTSLNSFFVTLFVNSFHGQTQIDNLKGAKTTKQTELGVNNFSNLVICAPPLTEQKAIVAKVEKLLALCDQLESEIAQNQENAEKLLQAVLREAFSQPGA
jgi:type I restriction enzyme, S subunit